MSKTCSYPTCDRGTYGEYCLAHRPRKPIAVRTLPKQHKPLPRPKRRIKQMSAKERNYQVWKETVARPYLIARDGNNCQCCKRPAGTNEKLDIDHVKNKGSHRALKQDLNNLQFLCRWPCHVNKTAMLPCHS